MLPLIVAVLATMDGTSVRPSSPPQPCRCFCEEPAGATAASATEEGSRWYGGPAIAVDAASLALMVGGLASNNGAMLLAGGGGYLLGAPLAHLVARHPSHAAASIGLRLLGGGLASGAVLLDVLSHPCDGEPSCQHSPSAGLALATVTLLAASAIDDAWLARESVGRGPERASLEAGIALAPKTAFFSVGGAF